MAPRAPRVSEPETQDFMAEAQQMRAIFAALAAAARFLRASYWLKLVACVLVDAIGLGSFLLPGLGELGDVAWAPMQGVFLLYMCGTRVSLIAHWSRPQPSKRVRSPLETRDAVRNASPFHVAKAVLTSRPFRHSPWPKHRPASHV
uniref:Uncharacterized protein n=1 Tax=Calcidiscus leptoporus TaxID=127549 RepID=A0A7S0IYM5_9EUKA|mmetsp:Transcript_28461/g.66614  ORF Transcript_28461/g.66614 Transcript_28461/m.66614 type:complete len:146 (+) Transcript_28461:45-482(+)